MIEKIEPDLWRNSITGVMFEIAAICDKLNEIIDVVNDLAKNAKNEINKYTLV